MYTIAHTAGGRGAGKSRTRTIALALVASAAALAAPIAAYAQSAGSAALTVHRLDVQLQQANARCAKSDSRFAAAYDRLIASRGNVFASAERELGIALSQQMGGTAARAEIDRIDREVIAAGVPDCASMTAAMEKLSTASGSAQLIAVADQIVNGAHAPGTAMALADR